MSVRISQLVENFPDLLSLVRGPGETEIRELQAPSSPVQDSLIFVSNPEHLKEALGSKARNWVVNKTIQPLVPREISVVLLSPNVPLAMALIGKRHFPLTRHFQVMGETLHPQAVISPSAKLGSGCIVGPGAVIADDVEIGADCIIGANCVIERGVRIGARSHIHPLVFIGRECILGAENIVKSNSVIGGDGYGYATDKNHNHHRINHYGKVVTEDRVNIGAGVQIDRGTYIDSFIGEGTKIDNHCHFGHNIVIGKHTLVTGGMIAAGSVTIGSYCVFGGRTTIAGHLEICDRVNIGGMSGITKSITEPGTYGGLPLQEMSKEMRTRATLKDIPSMNKQIKRILKHLGLT